MIEKLLIEHVMKKGRTTTEFGTMIVTGLVMGAVSLGIIDLSPDQIGMVTANVMDGGDVIQKVASGSGGLVDGLMRIVALIIGGQVASNYIKSRGNAKSAQAMVAVKAAMNELEKFKKDAKEGVEHEVSEPTV